MTEPQSTIAQRPRDATSDEAYAEFLIRRILQECPARASGSPGERLAQRIVGEELTRRGGVANWQAFRFASSLYAVIALHFTLATMGALSFFVSPLAAALLCATAAVSYIGDSYRWFYLLRRLAPKCHSQNLIVTFPAHHTPRRRLVVVAHADAAPTGWLFHPRFLRWTSAQKCPRPLRFLTKPLLMAVIGFVVVAALSVDAWWQERLIPRRPAAFFGFAGYFAIAAVMNWQLVWRRQIAPGANDNLSSCAALPILAERLAAKRSEDTELLFVVTGCEEAGTGGALALAQHMVRQRWPGETYALVLEVIGHGEPRLLREGELWPVPIPGVLLSAVRDAAAIERFNVPRIFQQPAGATDALPFLRYGIPALALGCIDPVTGVPANYHSQADTAGRLDYRRLVQVIDLAEAILRRLMLPGSAVLSEKLRALQRA